MGCHMKFFSVFVTAAFAAFSISAFASESEKWGMVKASYTVGSSKLVAKDQGVLEISLQLTCVENATDTPREISGLMDRLNQEIKKESEYSLGSLNPEIAVSSLDQYELRYDSADVQQLKPAYVDVCNNMPVKIGSGAIDLTKKYFTAQ